MSYYPPPSGNQPPRKPKMSRAGTAVLVGGAVVVALAVFGFIGNATDDGGGYRAPTSETFEQPPPPATPQVEPAAPVEQAPAEPVDTTHEVVYRVDGSGSAVSVTYSTNGTGASSQANGESLPWSKTESIEDNVLNVYSLIAQNEGSGEISCSISVDGEQVAAETSTGPYAVVMCTTP